MVCVDGFILTHAYEQVNLCTQEEVDGFLPPYEPVQVLDPGEPVSIGSMVGPEAFMEVRYLAHYKQLQALSLIPQLAREFELKFGRSSGGLLHTYRVDGAETLIVAMGSVNGTIKDVIDEMRDDGHAVGAVVITSFRPFPLAEVRSALAGARRVLVIEKNIGVGLGGVLASNVRMALRGEPTSVLTCIAGLGGRPITKASLRPLFEAAERDELDDLTFLDLKWDIVRQQLERMNVNRRSGPIAESIMRLMGVQAP